MKQYYRLNTLEQKYEVVRWIKGITIMLFNLHIVDLKNYCSLVHYPVPHVKQSTPAHSTLLNLVTKYYSLSTNLPRLRKNCSFAVSPNLIRGMLTNYEEGNS